jgi:hypothetical protein
MLFQIVDTLIIALFVVFLIAIFRGYHLSKRGSDYKDVSDDGGD